MDADAANGSWHWTITIGAANFPPTTASITYTGKAGTLTLSGCDEGGAQPSASPARTASTIAERIAPCDHIDLAQHVAGPDRIDHAEHIAGPDRIAGWCRGGCHRHPDSDWCSSGCGRHGGCDPSPTDALGSVQPGSSNDGWRNVLIGLATLLIFVLAFTAPRRSSRRR